MSPRLLVRLLTIYGVGVLLAGLGVHTWFSLGQPTSRVVVETWWSGGVRTSRFVRAAGDPPSGGAPPGGVTAVDEEIVGEGPLLMFGDAFAMGLVPGLDGVKVTLDGKVAYATVDDLLSAQAYDRAHVWLDPSFGWGTDRQKVLDILAKELGTQPAVLLDGGVFRRVRIERRESRSSSPALRAEPLEPRPAHVEASDLTPALVRDAVREAAYHLARGVNHAGDFRYLVSATTNTTLPEYNWPRHAGTTLFVAQAARFLRDPALAVTAVRAAERLRDGFLQTCGEHRCIGYPLPMMEIGSSALGLLAFVEVEGTVSELARSSGKSVASFRPAISALADFLRSQQRPDGELKHLYNRFAREPVDVQFLYYTGEAALALARAHTVTNDPHDLDAASRALSRLAGGGWSFFGSRYFYSEEHWTCQAVAELWARAPNPEALAFCARWHEFQRRLQYDAGDSPFDEDGGFGFGPVVSPRFTAGSSRGEAAGALLEVYARKQREGQPVDPREMALVKRELERAVAFVLRSQFHPGPAHLFADPVAARGGVPGSPVDYQLRIDYAQHAGGMFLRWLETDSMLREPSAR